MCEHWGDRERDKEKEFFTTGAKNNRGDEKNMVGLAHSRVSRSRSVTNKNGTVRKTERACAML